ncbi:glutamyl-tRNA reductase [Corynebacterium poyangense]|uniref:Glutamyl-tRNA reductase n=1 Tax=Corynebacterium poyangense TaxID=2684405 RepID=A0A7H0SLU9_9CORY|nr:glutamyl-tRNA reductase [Corynebacterium poyangense]MBZ8177631.1 glutamyl-tRNA reductase [Corynebacterium poyangense]QNQ89524.1 glutamyl-tRNA reductase [Corynebacterium poyangense]
MSVLVVGMSHRCAPVALLEQLSMDQPLREEAAAMMVARPSLSEAMIISTCNRLEVYTVTASFHFGVQEVVEVLHDISGVDEETLRSYLYVRYADAAAEHLMVVAAGLDSMVIGEQQIIGQVRTAYQEASELGTVGPALHSLAQTALHTGKRIHSETSIDEAGGSMVSFALEEALSQMNLPATADLNQPFHGTSALVLGAGAMASLAATHLGKLGIKRLIIANRTREHAERLAKHAREAGVSADVVEFDDRFSVLSQVDIAVSATGADHFTITQSSIPSNRAPHLMLIDLSLPRDIDDDAALLSGVHLVNIERLHQAIDNRDHALTPSTQAAFKIVSEELDNFTSEQRVRDVVPAVAALRKHANEVANNELKRLKSRVPGMPEADFEEASRAVRRVVDKLLHEPTVRVKKLAAESGMVSYESALQELFGLAHTATESQRSTSVKLSQLPDAREITTTPASAISTVGASSSAIHTSTIRKDS